MQSRTHAPAKWLALALFYLGLIAPGACQNVAFPGAEGAGKYAVGGRNSGNVYVVTNLNDSGAGSLRHAVDTAPQAGRMIVFGVGGTINLASDLIIDSPYLTIAGQSAPDGGVTLARRGVQVKNTHNVILQHLRIRPGDYYTGGPAGPPTGYEPDALWVSGSNNVMVDHISTSWSTDEGLSVTHGSTNVTVQWSMITEALHDSNHSGGNHGFGSIIHGGETTLHHNLYANNRSRNPALGNFDKAAAPAPAHLDVVNNVISNPGDRYSYSGGNDQYDVNWVGNFGVAGPETSAQTLFNPAHINTRVYFAGNHRDASADGILQLTPAGAGAVGGTYTPLANPAVTTNPPTMTDAATAYQQVLSYAGASAYRDPIDKRIIHSVVNQNGTHIDSQEDVGGWYAPQPVTHQLDPDGLPDWWKSANGFSPNDNAVGAQLAPDGYTYLEKYLHEKNAPYMPPVGTAPVTVSTAQGLGADGQISEVLGASSGDGLGGQLTPRWVSGERDDLVMLRFDLSNITPGTVADASLELTAYQDAWADSVWVYGLKHELPDQAWDEGAIDFAAAPGVAFDADSSTRDLNADDLLLLGEFTSRGAAAGDTVSFSNPDLSVFLNLLAYRGDGSSTVTLLLERQDDSSDSTVFASKETTTLASGASGQAGSFAPRLVLHAQTLVAEPLAGDYNDDGMVDGRDYAVWREAMATGATLVNETASPEVTDAADLDAWLKNYGSSRAASANPPVAAPEPAGAVLMLVGTLSLAARRASSPTPTNQTASSATDSRLEL